MVLDRFVKGVLVLLALLLGLNLALLFGPSSVALAQKGASEIGRYQVSAWGAYSGERIHHSGYYVVDTMTGRITDRGHEIHGIEKGGQTH